MAKNWNETIQEMFAKPSPESQEEAAGPLIEFAFDLKLDVAVRIEAETFEDAVKFLKDNLDCAWAEFKKREGDEPTVYGEATLNGEVTKDMLFEPEVCPECGAIEGTSEWGTVGDGYDGYCPNCADKRERERVYDS